MPKLKELHCAACDGPVGTKALSAASAKRYMHEIEGWELAKTGKEISKELVFKDFDKAMDFVNLVADIAEQEGHHPDIHISYNKVRLELSTHAVGGLTENDFILASKIDAIHI